MTEFLFVRHGEPDYAGVGAWKKVPLGEHLAGLTDEGRAQIEAACLELAKYPVEFILASPYTRTMHSAAIMAKNLGVDVLMERELHEWDADMSYSVTDEAEIRRLCQEHNSCHGIYPAGETRLWESKAAVRDRVLKCLSKYTDHKCIAIAGHAMMIQAVLGAECPVPYGGVFRYVWGTEMR